MNVQQMEKHLADLCYQIYLKGEIRFTPRYPWVLVRVLPKAQQIGRIILPQNQNKIMYEGIVLAVWAPFWIHKDRLVNGNWESNRTLRVSQLGVGMRIGFPHYEGLPVRYFDENNYRVVREEVNLAANPNCGVLGEIEYDGDRQLKDELDRLLAGASMVTVSGV